MSVEKIIITILNNKVKERKLNLTVIVSNILSGTFVKLKSIKKESSR